MGRCDKSSTKSSLLGRALVQRISSYKACFPNGAPYVTTYIDGPIRCSDDQILCNLYYAGGERRTAQTFVCWFPSGESIDVVNVHAPDGHRKLKDPQRMTLLTTLLQSRSQTRPDASIGNAHSSPDASVVEDVSRRWYAAHAGANSSAGDCEEMRSL